MLAPDDDLTRERDAGGPVYAVPWLEEAYRTPYARFIERVVDVGDRWRLYGTRRSGYSYTAIVSEQNGVGAMPTETLRRRLSERNCGGRVIGVHTDARLKETAFGMLKLWMQQGRLVVRRGFGLVG